MTVISTSSITPLMMASVPGLINNQGLRVNAQLDTDIRQYCVLQATDSTPAGTIISDGDALYLLDTNLVTYTDGNNSVTTMVLTQTPYGSLSAMGSHAIQFEGAIRTGSLSAIGGTAAYYVSGGYVPPESGTMTWQTSTSTSMDGNSTSTISMPTVTVTQNPITWDGKYLKFYGNADATSLGQGTIPALTQVVPSTITAIDGMTSKWMDQLIVRILGSNTTIDMMWFTSLYAQAKGFLAECNPWLDSTRLSEKKKLEDFGANSYQDFVGQEFIKYKHGSAITSALTNLGDMIDSLTTGKFGTPGAVAYTLINSGLGNTSNLGRSIVYAGINSADIMNPMYEPQIISILSNITDPADLRTIQSTMKSNVPDMVSPMDYTLISNCAGMPNDSLFANLVEVGQDLNSKSQYLNVDKGANVATLINSMIMTPRPQVEALAGTGPILNSSTTTLMRGLLPISQTDTRVTLYDIIGFTSGYCKANLEATNDAVTSLDSTEYGPRLIAAYRDLLSTSGSVIVHGSAGDMIADVAPTLSRGDAINNYNALITEIMSDSRAEIQNIVAKMNTNFKYISDRIVIENHNYLMGDFQKPSYTNSRMYFAFAQGLHNDALDAQEINSCTYLTDMADKSTTGDVILSLLDEGKNINTAQIYSIEPKGFVG